MRKAFFFGYMIHRMLQCVLGRRDEDDRDHFGKKRLDLAGPLIANLFRVLFLKLTKDVYKYLQKCVENNSDFNVQMAVRASVITNGLKYSLATGNWGDQKKAKGPGMRAPPTPRATAPLCSSTRTRPVCAT